MDTAPRPRWPARLADALDLPRRERDGLTVLLAAVALLVLVPEWTAARQARREAAFWAALPAATRAWMDSVEAAQAPPPDTLFPFDPNTLDEAGWVRLGLDARLAARIGRYRAAGGRFRDAEDLLDLYGFPQPAYERLAPWVRIGSASGEGPARTEAPPAHRTARAPDPPASGEGPARMAAPHADSRADPDSRPGTRPARRADPAPRSDPADPSTWRPYTGPPVDLNRADAAAFDALPGIGARLAERAVRFRERLGGFHTVDQFGELYGLDPAVFALARPHLRCDGSVRQLRLNGSPLDSLRDHPYIAPWIAERIVTYRARHGGFLTLDELRRVRGVNDSVYGRLQPYLRLGAPP